MAVADLLAVPLVKNQVDIQRYAESARIYVAQLLEQVRSRAMSRLAGGDPTAPVRTEYQQQRLEQIIGEINAIIGKGYDKVATEMERALYDMTRVQQASVLGIVNGVFGTNLMTHALTKEQLKEIASDTLIQGAKSRDWWAKQADDMRFAFEKEMREGMLAGESLGELVQRIKGKRKWKDQPAREAQPGFFEMKRHNAEALVRTSVMTVANATHLAVYQNNSDVINTIQWVSTLDLRTTPTCRSLDGKTWDVMTLEPVGHSYPFPGPTAHWGCRSTQIPITKSWEELATQNKHLARKLDQIDPSTRASMDGQVARKMTYEQWFEQLNPDQQLEVLGKSRYELWSKTKHLPTSDPARITLSDMLDQKANPLSLGEFAKQAGYKLDNADELRLQVERLKEEAKRLAEEHAKKLEEARLLEEAKKRAEEEAKKVEKATMPSRLTTQEMLEATDVSVPGKDWQRRFFGYQDYVYEGPQVLFSKINSVEQVDRLIARTKEVIEQIEKQQYRIKMTLRESPLLKSWEGNETSLLRSYKAKLKEFEHHRAKLTGEPTPTPAKKAKEKIQPAASQNAITKDKAIELLSRNADSNPRTKLCIKSLAEKMEERGVDARFLEHRLRIQTETMPNYMGGYFRQSDKLLAISDASTSAWAKETMVHEFGHSIDWMMVSNSVSPFDGQRLYEFREAMRAAYNAEREKISKFFDMSKFGMGNMAETMQNNRAKMLEAFRLGKCKAPSAYSLTNNREFFAECFTEYVMRPEKLMKNLPDVFKAFEKALSGHVYK